MQTWRKIHTVETCSVLCQKVYRICLTNEIWLEQTIFIYYIIVSTKKKKYKRCKHEEEKFIPWIDALLHTIKLVARKRRQGFMFYVEGQDLCFV